MNGENKFSHNGLTIAVSITPSGHRLSAVKEKEKPAAGASPRQIWLRIAPDETVTVYIGKSEMGQGVSTSLPMIVADEIDADFDHVRCETSLPGTEYRDPVWGVQMTGGSTSVRHLFMLLRKVGAAAREMLIQAAARTWGVPPEECDASGGAVRHGKSGQSLTYGALSSRAAELPAPQNPRLKSGDRFRYIGSPMSGLDAKEKTNGTAIFGSDVFIPDMLYATIDRPPAFGMKSVSYDEKAALIIPGVNRIGRIKGGIGVCADSPGAAWKGRDALKTEWGSPHLDFNNQTLDEIFARHLKKKGITARQEGNVVRALARASRKIESIYTLPYLAHVTMEPMNCTAHVRKDQCDVWAPTQNQSDVIRTASEITGLAPEQVYVHTTYIGGGFGRRLEVDYAEEAVRLSKACGRPVKLIWTREEDLRNDFYRPACWSMIRGGLDAQGRPVAWSQKIVVPPLSSGNGKVAEERVDPSAVDGLVNMSYGIPNIRIDYVSIGLPIPVGYWRSVGHSHNAFIKECFIDELALEAGKDPLEFRLGLLREDHRSRRVLEVAAEKAGWGRALPEGHGLGIAQQFSFGSAVAQVVEVSWDEGSGKIRVHRVTCAIDCGPVINPGTVAAQMEGGIIFGLSAALKEEVVFEKGGVKTANFDSYDILRMRESPEIEVHIVKSTEEMGGVGEPGVPPIAPAVANAFFRASGIRVRRLPLRPSVIKESSAKQ